MYISDPNRSKSFTEYTRLKDIAFIKALSPPIVIKFTSAPENKSNFNKGKFSFAEA